jgi:hypothetical protein
LYDEIVLVTGGDRRSLPNTRASHRELIENALDHLQRARNPEK